MFKECGYTTQVNIDLCGSEEARQTSRQSPIMKIVERKLEALHVRYFIVGLRNYRDQFGSNIKVGLHLDV